MKPEARSQKSEVSCRKIFLYCLLLTAYCFPGCSVPNLEKPQCTAARDTVKRFYSYHFGNDMRPSAENLKASESFLTSELLRTLSAVNSDQNDYFTATDNYPKAFRVGSCVADSAENSTLQVVLLWRDETKSEQKEVHVETVLVGDKWLINRVSN